MSTRKLFDAKGIFAAVVLVALYLAAIAIFVVLALAVGAWLVFGG